MLSCDGSVAKTETMIHLTSARRQFDQLGYLPEQTKAELSRLGIDGIAVERVWAGNDRYIGVLG